MHCTQLIRTPKTQQLANRVWYIDTVSVSFVSTRMNAYSEPYIELLNERNQGRETLPFVTQFYSSSLSLSRAELRRSARDIQQLDEHAQRTLRPLFESTLLRARRRWRARITVAALVRPRIAMRLHCVCIDGLGSGVLLRHCRMRRVCALRGP
ncbi:hypothetical protein DENSPDRAFT_930517 [Dentipellis sp. KUC8613]|nr:hypothetical protein DENSPDRAFT_930517 [Dentipellis sp. KUC8613]